MNAQAQEVFALGKPAFVDDVRSIPPDWLDTLPPEADCLRDYQRQMIANIATEMHSGHSRILAQAPTGAGKTHVMVSIVSAAVSRDLRVLVLATRTRLVRQIHERLESFGIRHGVIAAPLPHLRNYSARVQVASVDTLNRRALVSERIPLPSADVVIFDEAHLATAETRLRLLDSYPGAVRIGFTATPARKSGKSLAAAFDCLILGPPIRDLTAAGVLVPMRIFNTPVISVNELRSVPKDMDSDFKTAPLGEILSRPKLVGDVVENWLRIANRKRTLLFAVNKAHGAALLDSFRKQGVAAEMLTDADEDETREEIIGRLETGETSVIINCFLLAYGVDVPSVECIVLARPTRSLTMYLQMVGRGLRASPGKTQCIVIDHGHVVENLGLPQSDFEWSLDPNTNVNAAAMQSRARPTAVETLRTCRECSAIWLTSEQGHSCPSCGWAPLPKSKPVAFEEADLEEIADVEGKLRPNDARVVWFYREACSWYLRRWPDRWAAKPNSGRAWAWMQTQARFNIAANVRIPSAYWTQPLAPLSPEVSGWLQHRLIKFARSKGRTA